MPSNYTKKGNYYQLDISSQTRFYYDMKNCVNYIQTIVQRVLNSADLTAIVIGIKSSKYSSKSIGYRVYI